MSKLKGYTVSDHLHRPGAWLRASARFGEGLAAALWERTDRGHYRYEAPNHHTLCFGLMGGEAYRRRRGRSIQPSFGEGQSVILPAGVTSDWEASGKASVFHLYIPTAMFERRVVETLDADPKLVVLRDDGFQRDRTLEAIIRSTVLPLSWDDPADRIAMTEAGELLTAYLATRCSEREPRAIVVRGGLAPTVLRRVRDYIEDHLHQAVTLGDLAAEADLSPFHFAHAFKRSTGCSPHQYVLRRRIERAKRLLRADGLSLSRVAQACGYGSHSHFAARFRAATGVTPDQFSRWRSERSQCDRPSDG
jgi:AraC family transcriptional regulator